MPVEYRYRGSTVGEEQIAFLRQLIAAHPELSLCALSRRVCEARQWKQANGALREMVCRRLMLALERAGHITLPPIRRKGRNHLAERKRPEAVVPDNRPLCGALRDLGKLDFRQVRRTPQEPLFNSLLEQYHYLGYEQSVGEQLKYLVSCSGQAIACLAWCSAPRHLASRHRFIGWGAAMRKRTLQLLAYNTRFLILPWVRVPHLASHILGRMTKLVPQDWQQLYAHPIYWLETFVDAVASRVLVIVQRTGFRLGRTTGRGHNACTKKATQPVKELLGLPLRPRFRQLLGA